MRLPDLERLPDDQLVGAFTKQGDRDALEVLLRRHETRVYGLAYRILGNRPDALDASQEVFVTVFRKVRTFKGEAAFTTWLHRLTVNACHDLGRRKARAPQPAEMVEGVAEDRLSAADERMAVGAALAGLPVEQRTAIVLRDLRDLSYQEIAEVTRVPVGTVKSRIARARMALAGLLEPAEDPMRPEEAREPEAAPTRLTDRET